MSFTVKKLMDLKLKIIESIESDPPNLLGQTTQTVLESRVKDVQRLVDRAT